MKRLHCILAAPPLLLAFLLFGTPAAAEKKVGIKILPGLWQVTKTINIPAAEQSNTDVKMQCMKEELFTPPEMMAGDKSCKTDTVSASEKEISWKILCKNPGGDLTEVGSFKSSGDKLANAKGKVTATLRLGSESIVTETLWMGERLGECGMKLPKKPKKSKKSGEASESSESSKADKADKADKAGKAE